MSSNNDTSQVYAFFRNHAIPNEGRTRAEGRPIYDDMEVCEIRLAGNKQSVGVFPANDVAEWREDMNGFREAVTYAQKYPQQYQAFKANNVQTASGTPIDLLPFLTQGQKLELRAVNVHTAEALAGLDGAALKRIGVGGRDLKNQAQDYLDAAGGAVELGEMRSEIEALQAKIAQLEAEGGKKRAKKAAAVDEPAVEASADANPFVGWEADDLRLWILDMKPATAGLDQMDNAALEELAKSINDELAKKAV